MSDIFISYKREEQATARKLADALENEGLSVWWDPKLRAGEHFDDVIEEALNEAKCVIVLWSERSVQSRYVRDEATYALDRDKLVPVAIENVSLPFRFRGVHTLSLLGWDSSKDFSEFRKLLDDISAILEPRVDAAERSKKEAADEENRRRIQEERNRATQEAKQRPEAEAHRKADEYLRETQETIKKYKRIAIYLAAFIIPLTIATYTSFSISEALRKDIETANSLSVKLYGGKDVLLSDVQEFTLIMRGIDSRARQLNFFVGSTIPDPFPHNTRGHVIEVEIVPGMSNLSEAVIRKVAVYIQVRSFALSILDIVSTVYGAIAIFVLPVNFALLVFVCAYLFVLARKASKLRTFNSR